MITNFTQNKDSFILAYSYSELINSLTVIINKPNNAYQYIGVPLSVVSEFANSEHKGKYFSQYIKPKYPVRKLSPGEFRYELRN